MPFSATARITPSVNNYFVDTIATDISGISQFFFIDELRVSRRIKTAKIHLSLD